MTKEELKTILAEHAAWLENNQEGKCADLRHANLYCADLSGADLYCADLRDANLPHFQICPTDGSFIAWKAVVGGVVLKLTIPEDAQRTSSLVGRKCRASHVTVLESSDKEGTAWMSKHDPNCIYRVGETVMADSFDDDIRVECSNGIHFFMTEREAREW